MQQPFIGGHGSSAEDRLEYFYLNLVGQLVHVHTTDKAIIEGLFVSRIDPNQYPESRKQQCKDQVGGVILRYYRYCQSPVHGVDDPAKLNDKDLLIYYDQLLFMEVASLKLRTKTPGSGHVQTFRGGRDLEKLDWAGKEELLEGSVMGDTSPRGSGGVGGWDQFKTNAEKFGVRSSYKEEHYTTKLDKAEFTSDQIKQAEAVAQEIEKAIPTHGPAHVMDRHEIAPEEVDEGQLFSDVIRPSDGGSKGNPPPPPPSRNALEQPPPVVPTSNASPIARGKGGKNVNTNTNAGMVTATGGSRNAGPHAGGPAAIGKGTAGTISSPGGMTAGTSASSTSSSMLSARKGDPIPVGGAGNNAMRSPDGISGGAEGSVSGGPHSHSTRPLPSTYVTAAPFLPMSATFDDFLETVGTALQQNPHNTEILDYWPGDESLLASGRCWPTFGMDPNYASMNTGKTWGMDLEEANLSHGGGGMMSHGVGGGLPGGGGNGGVMRMSAGGGIPGGHHYYGGSGPGMMPGGMNMKVGTGGPGGGGGVVPQGHSGVLPHGGPGGMGNMPPHMGHPMSGNGGSGGGGLPAHYHDSMSGMTGSSHLHPKHHNGVGSNGGGYNNGNNNNNNGNGTNNTNNNGMLGMSHPHHLGNNGVNNSNTNNNNNNANTNNFQVGGGNPNNIPLSRHAMSGQSLQHGGHPAGMAPPPQGHSSLHYPMPPMSSSHPPSHHPGPGHSPSSSTSPLMGVSGHPPSVPGVGHHSGHTGTPNNTTINGEGSGNSGSNTNLGGGGNAGGSGVGMYASGSGIKGSPTPPQSHLLVPGGGPNPNMSPGPIYGGGNSNAMRNNGGYMGGGSGGGGYGELSPAMYGNNSNNNVPSPVMGGSNDSSGVSLNINAPSHMFHNNNNNTNNSMLTTGASTTAHHTPTPSSASAVSNKNGNNHSSSPSLPPPPSSSNHSPPHQIGGSTTGNNTILSNQNSSNANGNLSGNSGPVGGRGGASRPPKMTQQQPHQPVAASSTNTSGGAGGNAALPSHLNNSHAHHSHQHPEANHMNSSGSPPPPPGGAILTNVENGINASGKNSNLQEKSTGNLSVPATTASTGARKLRRGGRDDKRGSK